MDLQRVGVYGGTFDPVHRGHVEVARRVLELFRLDQMILVPACVPPHKRNANITSAFHRFAMLALATEMDRRLLVSTIELDSPDRPYAVETIARLQNDARQLFFLIGADSWLEITTWKDWQQLLQMCHVIVATRPGYDVGHSRPATARIEDVRAMNAEAVEEALARDAEKKVFLTDVAMIDISASRIRAAARAGEVTTLRAMVPPAVATYIDKHGLYKN